MDAIGAGPGVHAKASEHRSRQRPSSLIIRFRLLMTAHVYGLYVHRTGVGGHAHRMRWTWVLGLTCTAKDLRGADAVAVEEESMSSGSTKRSAAATAAEVGEWQSGMGGGAETEPPVARV